MQDRSKGQNRKGKPDGIILENSKLLSHMRFGKQTTTIKQLQVQHATMKQRWENKKNHSSKHNNVKP